MAIGRMGKLFAVFVVCVSVFASISVLAESKARIVRLSEVQGTVQMDRGDGFEKTFLNMPVVEGTRLKTGVDGRAEVEFEDGSALRLVPNSEVVFTRLSLGDDGAKLSAVQVNSGTAYVNGLVKRGNQITLSFGSESIELTEPVHFRIQVRDDNATLAVFKGKLRVNGQSGPVEVSEKHSATFDINSNRYEVARNYQEDADDVWDRQQTEYHDRYASRGTVSSPYAYGMSDLGYYGNFSTIAGYGTLWQPYFVGAGWSPFQDGGWAFYPGFGYMWVSSYPWGWMPYRYGNWLFIPGQGWFWQPGYWNSWYAVPRVVNPPAKALIPKPPVNSRATVMVGKGLTANPVMPVSKVTLNPGSAGIGIPRGAVRNLDRASREVGKNDRPLEARTLPAGQVAAPPRSARSGSSGSTRSGGSSLSSGSRPSTVMTAPRSSVPVRSSRPH
jgi:hypothetical protein